MPRALHASPTRTWDVAHDVIEGTERLLNMVITDDVDVYPRPSQSPQKAAMACLVHHVDVLHLSQAAKPIHISI